MANEIQAVSATGITLYAVIRRASDGQFYNTVTPGFEAYNAANWVNYDFPMTEQGASGTYYATMPAVAAGVYQIDVRLRVGGAVAVTDPSVGAGELDWDGTAPTVVASRAQIADSVWDEAVADHVTAGSTGAAIRLSRSLAGKWVVSANQLLIYDTDGVTLLATQNLTPAGGPFTARTPV